MTFDDPPPGRQEDLVEIIIPHIDTTVIRLLDGTCAYARAVIDNFSRRILAWRVRWQTSSCSVVAASLRRVAGPVRT